MGSPLRLIVVGADAVAAERAWAAVRSRIEVVEEALSRFRAGSAVTRLNGRAGDAAMVAVHRDLYVALAAADRAYRLTGGAFDPRVLVDLERLGHRGAPLTATDTPDISREGGGVVGLPGVADLDGTVGIAGAGTRRLPSFGDGRWLRRAPLDRAVAVAAAVDLGGIGKGLALRWALEAAAQATTGVGDAVGVLLEAGGDIVACGPAPQPGPWLIGIESPLADGEELAIIAIERGAVSTSSVAVSTWQAPDGRVVHHLLDPATGEPGGEGLLSVTVAGPDAAWTEVWSKALFLHGRRRIGERAREAGLAAWWVDAAGTLSMTPAARVMTAWDG